MISKLQTSSHSKKEMRSIGLRSVSKLRRRKKKRREAERGVEWS